VIGGIYGVVGEMRGWAREVNMSWWVKLKNPETFCWSLFFNSPGFYFI